MPNYEGPVEGLRLLFENSQQQWNASATCKAFTSQLRRLLSQDVDVKVTKVICFALGELNFKPPDWWRLENESQPEDKREAETSVIEGALTHHAIALTMADVARSCTRTGDTGAVRLLTQDPRYSDETKDMLRELGFEVVGDHGAGGFAELDDESIVFSAFPNAPVTQIIADLARPAVIICGRRTSATVFGRPRYLSSPASSAVFLTECVLGNPGETLNRHGRSRCGQDMRAANFRPYPSRASS